MATVEPDVVVEVGFAAGPLDATPAWTDVSAYVVFDDEAGVDIAGGASPGAGPTGRIEASRCSLALTNNDGRFDPADPAGPHYPIRLGCPLRVRARYPTPNLLDANQASIETDATGWYANWGCTLARSTDQATDGRASLAITTTAPGVGFFAIADQALPYNHAVLAGLTYSAGASFRAGSVSRLCRLQLLWYTGVGGFVGYAEATAVVGAGAWVELVATGVVPAGASLAVVRLQVDVPAAAGEIFYVDRLWHGAKDYWTPGHDGAGNAVYALFRGAVESWSPMWPAPGRSWVEVEAEDNLGLLNRKRLADQTWLAATAGPDLPLHLYRLGEAAPSTVVADTGGTLTPEHGTTVGDTTRGVPGGVAFDTDAAVGFRNAAHNGGHVRLPAAVGLAGVGAWTLRLLVRIDEVPTNTDLAGATAYYDVAMVAQGDYFGIAGGAAGWSLAVVPRAIYTDGFYTGPALSALWRGPAGANTYQVPLGESKLGRWLHLVWVREADGKATKLYINNSVFSVADAGAGVPVDPDNAEPVLLGGNFYGSPSHPGFTGAIDEVAFEVHAWTAGRVAADYAGSRIGLAGQLTGARMGTALDVVGWPAALRDLDPGVAPLPFVADSLADTPALGYLQALEAGEGGLFFVDGAGVARFIDRPSVFDPPPALATLVDTVPANLLNANQASVEVDVAGWGATINSTVARSVAQAAHGVSSLSLTATAAGDAQAATTAGVTLVTAGQTYTAMASFRAAATARSVRVELATFTAAGVLVGLVFSPAIADSAGAWTQVSVTDTAPAGAAYARVFVTVVAAAAAEVHYVDKIGIREGTLSAWAPGFGRPRELAYQHGGLSMAYDTLQTYTDVVVSRPTGSPARATDAARVAQAGPRTLSVTSASENAFEADDRARLALYRHGADRVRIDAVRLRALADPVASMPQVLGRRIGDPVVVGRTAPPGGAAAQSYPVLIVGRRLTLRRGLAEVTWATVHRPPVPNLLSANQASLEVDATGWAGALNCSVARSVAQASHGVASLAMTNTAAGNMQAATPDGAAGPPVVAGVTYTVVMSYRAATTVRNVYAEVRWYDASGSPVVGTASGAPVADTTTGWTQVSVTAAAPAGAAYAQVFTTVSGAALAEVHYVDRIGLAEGTAAEWYPGR